MDYKIKPSPKVLKYLKKLKYKPLKRKFLDVIYDDIPNQPTNLRNRAVEHLSKLIWIRKFRATGSAYRIAYSISSDQILPIILAGPHENFYRNLFTYLKTSAWLSQFES